MTIDLSILFHWYGLDWLAMALSFMGIWLINQKQAIGFLVFSLSMVAGFAVALMSMQFGYVVANGVNAVLLMRSYMVWRKDSEVAV